MKRIQELIHVKFERKKNVDIINLNAEIKNLKIIFT